MIGVLIRGEAPCRWAPRWARHWRALSVPLVSGGVTVEGAGGWTRDAGAPRASRGGSRGCGRRKPWPVGRAPPCWSTPPAQTHRLLSPVPVLYLRATEDRVIPSTRADETAAGALDGGDSKTFRGRTGRWGPTRPRRVGRFRGFMGRARVPASAPSRLCGAKRVSWGCGPSGAPSGR